MIEPTDEQMAEMIAAIDEAVDRELGYLHRSQAEHLRVIVRAVLAIVARDRCLEPRGHVYHPLRREPDAAPDRCSCPPEQCFGSAARSSGQQCGAVLDRGTP